ncbi:hypothetical protein AGDE_10747 [Angomonas deanei]|uniref:Uncharacterized protein n=1 Tax=Angomonas deanei TaxID=59799 RepID=A0A7G2BZ26_9TRYP|nr:hypothetical protein AGDE_10747 [Angomonas deanei]CAD2212796.1 hypothetical protein, conserved [Angomonas deanei]|eukprot:EPY27476.1 hypothetical protein AGDE_10747 [Angomonas deanei]
MTEVHSTVDSVTSTLTGLGTGLSRKGRDQMPTELADAVEESHKQYVNSLGVTTSAAEKRALMGLPAVEGVSAQEAEADWRQRVARARVAAADEGACDTQSIPDYAADPVVPRLAPEETVGSAVVHVEEALEKIKACAEGLTLVERDRDLVWWASALRTRDVKSHSVRANYHARAARMWCQRGMQQLLLESTYLNTTSKKSKDDIMKLRKQLEDLNHLYESTKERCATLTSETFELQSMIDEVGEHRMMLQQSLLAEVHERHLIPEENDDVLCAELSLLLQTTHFPPGVAEDAEKVSEWLKHNSTPLE